MKILLLFVPLVLFAEETKPVSDESLRARIAWLEQKLAATEQKSRACFNIYGAEIQLNALAQQEPPKPEPKEPAK